MPDPSRLSIQADFVDRVSPGLKKLEAQFKQLSATNKQIPKTFIDFQKQVHLAEGGLGRFGKKSEQMRREFKALQQTIGRVNPVIGDMTSSIGAFALGAGSAIGAVTAVGAALVVAGRYAADFASSMRELKFGATEAGLSVTQLKQLQNILPKFSLPAEQAAGAMSNFARSMSDMKQHVGSAREALVHALGPGGMKYVAGLQQMAERGASVAEELQEVFHQVDEIKKALPGVTGQQRAKQFMQALGLPGEWARIGGAEWKAKIRGSLLDLDVWQQANKAAEGLNKTLDATSDHLENWKNLLINEITPGTKALLDFFNGISTAAEKIDKAMKSIAGSGVLPFLNLLAKPATGGVGIPGVGLPGVGGLKGLLGGGGEATPDVGVGPRGGGGPQGGAPFGNVDPLGNWLRQHLPGGGGGRVPGTIGPVIPGIGRQGSRGGPGVAIPPTAGGSQSGIDGGQAPAGGGIDRSWQYAELEANPALKESLFRHALGENTDPLANQAVMEEAANRGDLRRQIHGAGGMGSWGNLSLYHDPAHEYFQGYRIPNAAQRRMLEENYRRVFVEGSDISHGAIDNSSGALAQHEVYGGGKFRYPGAFTNVFNAGGYRGDNRVGAPGVESFHTPGWSESGGGERAAYPAWRQAQLAGANPLARLSLTQALSGGMGKVDTSGSMSINIRAPRGASIRTEGFFRKMDMRRSIQMPVTPSGPVQHTGDDFGNL